MSRILTQEEVDALLGNEPAADSGVPGAASAPKDADRFDLRAPLIAAGRRLDLLRSESEMVAPAFGVELGQIFGMETDPESFFEELSQLSARELLGGLAQGSALGLIEEGSGQVVGGLILEAPLTALLLDRLQGGRSSDAPARERVSEIDRALLRVILSRLVRAVARTLGGGELRLSDVDPEPASGQLASRGGTLCAARFRVAGDFLDHRLELLLTADLARRMTEGRDRRDARELDAGFLAELGEVPIRTRVVIDGVTLPLGEVERIREGSVLQLGVPEGAPVGLHMNDLPVARGAIRAQGEGRTLEIVEFTHERPSPAPSGAEGAKA